ncbi:hypothetical protein EDB80DRAFT_877460 [Ilyonectria destructans]|nr:hypothetical protein EDB80DRAFT_877460 [Ilyonectria destructans]
MQEAAYYSGKLWNNHKVTNYNFSFANGFNASAFLLDPKAYAVLDEALSNDRPWMLTVAPIAPHSNWIYDNAANGNYLIPPQPALRHEHLFIDYKIPRNMSFNDAIGGAPSWIG